jgi:fatty-acyl-CoA synthase
VTISDYQRLSTPVNLLVTFFTSILGTTGLPKAALVTQWRLNALSSSISSMTGYPRPNDLIYCAQPLYHSAGLMACLLSFKAGGGVAIGRRFSARNFFKECAESGATGMM